MRRGALIGLLEALFTYNPFLSRLFDFKGDASKWVLIGEKTITNVCCSLKAKWHDKLCFEIKSCEFPIIF